MTQKSLSRGTAARGPLPVTSRRTAINGRQPPPAPAGSTETNGRIRQSGRNFLKPAGEHLRGPYRLKRGRALENFRQSVSRRFRRIPQHVSPGHASASPAVCNPPEDVTQSPGGRSTAPASPATAKSSPQPAPPIAIPLPPDIRIPQVSTSFARASTWRTNAPVHDQILRESPHCFPDR